MSLVMVRTMASQPSLHAIEQGSS